MQGGSAIRSLAKQYGPMLFLHRVTLFVAAVFLVLAVFWPIPHPQLWLGVAAALFGVAMVLWIPATIYGDLPVHEEVLHALKHESERFPRIQLAWQVVCESAHPTWRDLEDILFLIRDTHPTYVYDHPKEIGHE